ncbi:MAG: 3-isopropylmalate dehydratase [Thermodesulfobacteriota bacterium]
MEKIKGRVRKFGDNVDTDTVAPGPSLQLPIEEMKKYAFNPVYPEFYKTVREGDVIVAGSNFGCGSSREQATMVVKELGIRFVVCESMARIYLRNCIGLGIYPILCRGVSQMFDEGDEIEIDVERGEVKNPRTGKIASFETLSGTPLRILNAGGIIPILKKITEEN